MALSSSGISFGGLFSGLDTESIISQLLKLERRPIDLLEAQKKKLGFQQDFLSEVNSSILSLKSTMSPLIDDIAAQREATSSDETKVRASADVSAAVSSYTVEVIQKAYEHRVASDAQATGYTVAGAQSFDLTIDGETFNVSLLGGESLSSVAQKINSSTSGGGMGFMEKGEAFVVTDPLTSNQTLVIESKKTGTNDAITFADTTGWMATAGLVAGAAWKNELQAATDAQVKIDGVTVSSSTNTISGAIVGVTFTAVDFGTAEVHIGADDDTVIARIKDFVDKFNASTELMDKYMLENPMASPKTDEDLKLGVLRGDMDLASMKNDIRMMTTGYLDSDTTLAFRILSEIGIDSESSSGSYVSDKITLDENKLRTALSENREDVSKLLSNFATIMDDTLEEKTKVSIVQSEAGTFYQRILGLNDRIDSIDEDISNWEERVTAEETRLRNSYMRMEELLQQMQSQSSYLSSQLSNLSKATSSSS